MTIALNQVVIGLHRIERKLASHILKQLQIHDYNIIVCSGLQQNNTIQRESLSHHIIYHTTSYRITSHHITHHITPHHIASHRITSHHIMTQDDMALMQPLHAYIRPAIPYHTIHPSIHHDDDHDHDVHEG